MSDVAKTYQAKRRRIGVAMGVVTLVATLVFAVQVARAQGHGETQHAPTPEHGSVVNPQAGGAGHGGLTEHAAGDHADAAQGHHALPPINWMTPGLHAPPFVAVLLNFAILVFGYYYLGKKPVQKALVDRRASVAREIEEANRLLREAEERAKVYQAKLANLESEIETAKRSLTEAGKGDRDRILREADERAARMKRDATLLVDQEVKQIRQDLLRETIDTAGATALVMLRERVTREDHERLANEFLGQLAQVSGSTPGSKGVTA